MSKISPSRRWSKRGWAPGLIRGEVRLHLIRGPPPPLAPPPGGGDVQKNMNKIFNNKMMKERRQELRGRMPKAEVFLWTKLKGSALGYKFRRQYSIGRFIVDFYCPEIKLAIEIDGDSHFQGDAPVYDQDRQEQIESLGLKVVRFTNDQIFDSLEDVINEIRKSLPSPKNLTLSEGE